MAIMKRMWKCPRCKRSFANRNQSHFCGRHSPRDHLRGRTPHVIGLYREFARMLQRCGPVTVLPEKIRIAFHVRMSFAAVSFRRDELCGHVVLARRLASPRFTKTYAVGPRNHVHEFRLRSLDEFDGEVLGWLREAYRVGRQLQLSLGAKKIRQ